MNPNALLGLLPFLLIGLWLGIGLLLDWLSGWNALAARFPNRDEIPLDRLRWQSAKLGKGSLQNPWGGVNFGNCLRFDVCPTGLRIALWRLFAPLSRPFLVPWASITAEEQALLWLRYVRLSFGAGLPAMTISRRAYDRIAAAGKVPPLPPGSAR